MGQCDPLLAVAGIKEKEQANSEILGFVFIPNLIECPPRCERAEKADDQPKYLPDKGNGRNDAGGEHKYGRNKRAERREGGNKFCGAEKIADPGEGPIIPMETDPRGEEAVGKKGQEGKEGGNRFLSEFWHRFIACFVLRKDFENLDFRQERDCPKGCFAKISAHTGSPFKRTWYLAENLFSVSC